MSLLVRLVRVLVAALWLRPPLGPLETSAVTFRVWPNDLDLNRHMNNGRYLTLMDLGRIDLMVRNGIGRLAMRRAWVPVIGAATVRYRRSLAPFERYRLVSRVVSWDEKWFYLEQRFERDGVVLAVGLVQGLMLRKGGGPVPTGEVLATLGLDLPRPPLPDAVARWQAALAALGDGVAPSAPPRRETEHGG